MTTPLLVEVGDNDGTVHWHQGVERTTSRDAEDRRNTAAKITAA
jgi:hypothetical protein